MALDTAIPYLYEQDVTRLFARLALLNQAGVRWVSRVPDVSTATRAIVQERHGAWQTTAEGTQHWWSPEVPDLAQGPGRWIVVRTQEGEERARATFPPLCPRFTVTLGRLPAMI
ncbi:MAG TPA: hypothetical protein VF916_14330 [Ktedonobacterales bacterium]